MRAIACQLNRATQGQYPPGSTFKVVTATAGIDSGKYTPDSIINGDSPKTISGVPLENDNNQSFGPITLTKALTDSVNTVFAQVAENVGRRTMTEYMKRFGFYALPPIDLPARRAGHEPARSAPTAGRTSRRAPTRTSAASASGRAGCWSRRCRWRWWPPRWPTAASSWSRG